MGKYLTRFDQFGGVEEYIKNENEDFNDLARITQLIGALK